MIVALVVCGHEAANVDIIMEAATGSHFLRPGMVSAAAEAEAETPTWEQVNTVIAATAAAAAAVADVNLSSTTTITYGPPTYRPPQVCSPAWRSQWNELERRCMASVFDSHGVVNDSGVPAGASVGNKDAVSFSVQDVLVADGLLTFTIRSAPGAPGAAGGDTYTARLFKRGYVSSAYVRDNFDGSYSGWARVPDEGEYRLTVAQDWPGCSGLREDGLSTDSQLGFQVVSSGRLRFDRSERVELFTRLEAEWSYSGIRAPDVLVNVTTEQARGPDTGGGCESGRPGHVLAPGYYQLSEQGNDLHGRWVPNSCHRRRCASHAPPLSANMSWILFVGDSTTEQVKECLSAGRPGTANGPAQAVGGPCGAARFDDAAAIARGISPAMRAQWEKWRVFSIRYDGLEREMSRSINRLEQLQGWLCQWRGGNVGADKAFPWGLEKNRPLSEINDAIRKACEAPAPGPALGPRTTPIPLVVVNCGAHCVYRTPLKVFKEWVDAAAEVMQRIEKTGVARFAYKTSAAIHESAFHYAASDPPPASTGEAGTFRLNHDAKVFNQRHWRLTDARIRVFDGYAASVMRGSNITVLDHWSPSRAWPKVNKDAVREPASLKFPSTDDKSKDMRHHGTETLIAAVGEILRAME